MLGRDACFHWEYNEVPQRAASMGMGMVGSCNGMILFLLGMFLCPREVLGYTKEMPGKQSIALVHTNISLRQTSTSQGYAGFSLEHPRISPDNSRISPDHQPILQGGPKHLSKAEDIFQGAFRHLPGEAKYLLGKAKNLPWEYKHLLGEPSIASKYLPGALKHLPGAEQHQCL